MHETTEFSTPNLNLMAVLAELKFVTLLAAIGKPGKGCSCSNLGQE